MDRCTICSSSISSLHRAKRLNAAMVHATRARKAGPYAMADSLLWKTVVSLGQHRFHQPPRVPCTRRERPRLPAPARAWPPARALPAPARPRPCPPLPAPAPAPAPLPAPPPARPPARPCPRPPGRARAPAAPARPRPCPCPPLPLPLPAPAPPLPAPLPAPARVCVVDGGGVTGLRMAARIGQADHRVDTRGNQGVQKRCVMAIGWRAVPGAHHPPLVQDEAQWAAHHPPMSALPLCAHLRRAATPCPPRVDHLDPAAVCDTQHDRRCEKARGPRRVGREEAGQAGALRHRKGNTATESRISQREKARVPQPLMAYSRASVTTARGYSVASGCCGPSSFSWSTA